MKTVFCLTFLLTISTTALNFPAWAMARRPPMEAGPAPASVMTPNLAFTLRDCYELALERSETVAIAKEDIEEAEAQFFIAASEAVGDINFIMERSRLDIQKGGGDGSTVGGTGTDPDKRTRKFVINQPLFQGFKALGALTGAGSLRKEQKQEWLRARELLYLDVVGAYYGFLEKKEEARILEEILSLFQERIKELEERERIGRSRPSEVATARARMKTIEADRSAIQGERGVARHLLEFLTGVDWKESKLGDGEVPEKTSVEPVSYLEKVDLRPDVEAARQSVKTAWRGVIVAQSEFWPDISIEHTQYERREGFQGNIDWDFLFKIDVPLLQGGAAIGNVKKAVSLWKKEKLTYSKIRREAELEIKQSYEKWFSSLTEVRSLREAVKATEENFRLQKEEYAHNLVSNLDVLEALEELHQARRDANRANHEMKRNYWAFQVATGAAP